MTALYSCSNPLGYWATNSTLSLYSTGNRQLISYNCDFCSFLFSFLSERSFRLHYRNGLLLLYADSHQNSFVSGFPFQSFFATFVMSWLFGGYFHYTYIYILFQSTLTELFHLGFVDLPGMAGEMVLYLPLCIYIVLPIRFIHESTKFYSFSPAFRLTFDHRVPSMQHRFYSPIPYR